MSAWACPSRKEVIILLPKNNGLQNQPITYYKKGGKGKEKVFLDPNTLSKEGTVSARVETFSKDKRQVSIGINKAGSDWKSIKIKKVAENQYTDDVIDYVKSSVAAWYKKGFFLFSFSCSQRLRIILKERISFCLLSYLGNDARSRYF